MSLIRNVYCLAVALCLTGCGTNREAWKSISTHELACQPFEIVTVRGVHYEARIIAGTVYAVGDPEVL